MNKLKEVLNVFLEVSNNKNLDNVLEIIIEKAKKLTNSDAGTIYMLNDDKTALQFKVVQTDSLNIKMGGTHSKIDWPTLPLYKNGKENNEMVAVVSALQDRVIHIEDAYKEKDFNFEGTKKFDSSTGYRSKSMLVVPLKNHELEVIGVLQLINKKEKDKTVSFNENDEYMVISLANLASTSITKTLLIEELEKMLESLIETIGIAIDEKSKYTGGHIRRVAKLAQIIADEIDKSSVKIFKNIKYSPLDFKIIKNAGWLHDIGKVSTPAFIMDKAEKLETIYNRINEIRYKIEILKKESEIRFLKNEITEKEYQQSIKNLDENYQFLKEINIGGEFLSDEKVAKIEAIAKIELNLSNTKENLLSQDEVYNLSIRKGTLNNEERKKIEEHAYTGLKMLNRLYFPKKYRDIKHIAVNHHEKLNGKGYPRGLKAKDLVLEDRVLAVADIFEALTASDRPYKKAKKLSEVFKILYFMVKDNELDKDVVSLFFSSKGYLKYAKEELESKQIDEIDENIREFFKL